MQNWGWDHTLRPIIFLLLSSFSFAQYAKNHPYIPVPNTHSMFREGLITGLAIMVCLKKFLNLKPQLRPIFICFLGTDTAGLLCLAVQEKILHLLLDSQEKEKTKSQGEAGFKGGVSLRHLCVLQPRGPSLGGNTVASRNGGEAASVEGLCT